jgi:hypothetical protein
MGCIWPICVILSDVFRVRYKRTADLIMDQIAKIPVWETRTAWEGRKWAVIQSTDQCVTCLTMQCSWWTMFVYLLTKALPSKINPWITRLTRWTEHVICWIFLYSNLADTQTGSNSDGYVLCGEINLFKFKYQIWRRCYIFTANYFFSDRRCLYIRSLTDFMNLKIKPVQS